MLIAIYCQKPLLNIATNCNHLAPANRQVATAEWDTHYKRQQSTSWLDGRLQEHREWKVQHWS